MSGAMGLRPCGARHPEGDVCEKGDALRARQAAEAACGPARQRDGRAGGGAFSDGPGVGKDDAAHPAAPDDTPACGCGCGCRAEQASGSAAVSVDYRIPAMDCPAEEALIRRKLETVPGIESMECNLMRRVLTVRHRLPSTKAVESALKDIGMPPETADADRDRVTVFAIEGMDCPVEERLVRDKLAGMPGVVSLEFNLLQRTLRVAHAPAALPAVAAALDSLGMGARMLAPDAASAPAAPRIPWARLAVAGGFAALAEALDLLLHWQSGLWGAASVLHSLLRVAMPAASVAAIALSGLTTYRKGWLAVRNGNLNINALMSVAVTGAVCIGQYPEAAMVMVLFNISEAIEAMSLNRARDAVRKLLALAPETAVVAQDDGSWAERDIRLVATGSRVRVRPGERIALDGVLVAGHSAVNQAPITGESLPVEKNVGDVVYAGTVNTTGSFEFETTAGAAQTTLARIIHAVEEAQGSRAPVQRFVDAFARWYTPAVFAVSLLTALVPPLVLGRSWTEAVYTALVILVIGCPCALVISTPVSIVGGMAAATRYGILIKGGMFLELGRKLGCLALDKTGTLTGGRPRQTDFIPLGAADAARASALAAGLASRSDHPVSRAIAEHAAGADIAPLPVEDFAAVPGRGVTGIIDGERWHLGSRRLAEELGTDSAGTAELARGLERDGKTVAVLAGPRGAAGLFAVADTLRESSIAAVRELRALGVRTIMLTGDNAQTAAAIARQAGVDECRSELLPEDKLHIVEELERQGNIVGMAGDGINDAPALARAHIGFAMAGGGTDTAIETADVALMDDDLRKIPRFIRLSRGTWNILVQNIVLALGVKMLFFALTFTGHATMWMAVFADVGTALMVVANGLRAMRQ